MYQVIKPFTFYLDGINPTHFSEGVQALPEDAATVAVAEGWAEEATKQPLEALVKTPAIKGRSKK